MRCNDFWIDTVSHNAASPFCYTINFNTKADGEAFCAWLIEVADEYGLPLAQTETKTLSSAIQSGLTERYASNGKEEWFAVLSSDNLIRLIMISTSFLSKAYEVNMQGKDLLNSYVLLLSVYKDTLNEQLGEQGTNLVS